ncbi:MAG: hypothetical protein AAB334_00725 [Patescibacteria group bacterium]
MNKKIILSKFVKKFSKKQIITLKDLRELKNQNISTEYFLDFLNKKYKYFFHGSTTSVKLDENIKGEGKIFLTNNSSIAILKALFSNKNAALNYPYFIDKKHPLKLIIEKRNGYTKEKTILKKGYVYVMFPPIKIKNEPRKSWQYIIEKNTKIGIPFLKKIEIEKKDFLYLVKIKNK